MKVTHTTSFVDDFVRGLDEMLEQVLGPVSTEEQQKTEHSQEDTNSKTITEPFKEQES